MAIIIDLLNDTIVGTDNADSITSLLGDDLIFARGGDDYVSAGGGDDIVFGGDGDDELHGGTGHDVLVGGSGNDELVGGFGSDTFVFSQTNGATGHDVISDFQTGSDVLDLTATGITADDFSDTAIFVHDAGSNTLTINISADSSIQMAGIDAAEFAALADSIVFDTPTCTDITGTSASETFALAVDGCLTVTGFELGTTNPDLMDLSAFGVTAEGMAALDTAFNTALETDLNNLDFFGPPDDILFYIGDRNNDSVTDNADIEAFRTDYLNNFGFATQAEEDAFNAIIDAFLAYDFAVDFSTADLTVDITRDADGTTAGELTLIGLGDIGSAGDFFEDHVA